MSVPVYKGKFAEAQAERLLWRAGFGPKPGQAAAVAEQGLDAAVGALLDPPAEALEGPEPVDDRKRPIAPYDAKGHDHLWWLDRMVRSNQPLVERMTLVWHDWFATSIVGVKSQKLMLEQNAMFRTGALGSFGDLLLNVTKDPAMLVWLSGYKNTKTSPNENYGRELMELFTLGADRPGGYTEADVREQARALTGWRGQQVKGDDPTFSYEPRLHDTGTKTVFGQNGNFDWQDACRLCLQHPNHASYFVTRLWSYFVATTPPSGTQSALEAMYRDGYQVKPLVEAILKHPDLYNGARLVKSPIVYTAGLLRALGRGVDTVAWTALDLGAGQRLFAPPNVAGWDESRWLDTATFRGRWFVSALAMSPLRADERTGSGLPSDANALVDRAIQFWGNPAVTAETRKILLSFAKKNLTGAAKLGSGPAIIENALRQLVATSPDLQTA